MSSSKIILEDKYSTLQKTMIFLFSAPFLLFFYNTSIEIYNKSIVGTIIAVILLFLSCFLIMRPFTKKGFFVNSNQQLYLGFFLLKKCIRKKRIKLDNKIAISTLEYKTGQKMWSSVANPNLKVPNYIYQIVLLNENHTQKDKIIFLEKKENALKTIDFLVQNTGLKEEIFSPKFD